MGASTLILGLAVVASAYGHHATQGGIPGSEMYDKYSGKKIEEAASEIHTRIARQMPDMSSFTNPSSLSSNFSPDKFTSMAKPDQFMSAFSGSSGAAGSPAPAESAASEVKYRYARQMPDMSSFTNPSSLSSNFSPDKFTSMAKPDQFMSAFSGSSGAAGSPAPAESAASEVKYRYARQMPDMSSFTNPSSLSSNFSPDKFTSMAKPDQFMSAFSGSSGAAGSPAPAESAASEVKYRYARQMPDMSSFTNPSSLSSNFSPDKFTSMAKPDQFMSAFSGSSGAAGSPAPAESAASEVKYRYARQMPDMSSFTNPSSLSSNFSPDKFTSMAKPDQFMSAFSGSSGAAGSPAPAESAASEVKYRYARQMPDMSSFTNPSSLSSNFSPDKFTSMAKPDQFMSAFSGSSGAAGSPAPAESAASEVKYRYARQMPDMSSFTNPSSLSSNFSPDKFTSMAKPDQFMSAFSGSSGAAGSPAPAESAASEVKYRYARQMPDMSSFTNPSSLSSNFSPDKFTSMAKPDQFMSAFSGSSGAAGSPAPAESAASEVKYRYARQMPDMSSFTNPSSLSSNFSPDKFTSMAKPDQFMSAFSGSSGAAGSPAPAESSS